MLIPPACRFFSSVLFSLCFTRCGSGCTTPYYTTSARSGNVFLIRTLFCVTYTRANRGGGAPHRFPAAPILCVRGIESSGCCAQSRRVPCSCANMRTGHTSDGPRFRSSGSKPAVNLVLCRIYVVQIQPRKHVLDYADHTRSYRSCRSYRSYRSYRSEVYLP